jgi:hypothetical protein
MVKDQKGHRYPTRSKYVKMSETEGQILILTKLNNAAKKVSIPHSHAKICKLEWRKISSVHQRFHLAYSTDALSATNFVTQLKISRQDGVLTLLSLLAVLRIQSRIRMFMGLPDPVVRCTYPDPSIMKQK